MLQPFSCNDVVDYSSVIGDRILPFVFTLNLEDSILNPGEGEYQTFCYDVEGVGEDTSEYADLSHFLLGICGYITEEDFVGVSVLINGEEQTVVIGENVEIKTEENPDNPTQCVGLKFDFPLDKVDGTMQVCFSLATTYPIGSVNVCVYGGGTTVSGLAICGPVCGGEESCTPVFYQKETVCVPVTVTPYAEPGTARAFCCGEAVAEPGTTCSGNRRTCTFTVTQDLCIEVPIIFGADIKTGTAIVQCGELTKTPCVCGGTPVTVGKPQVKSTCCKGTSAVSKEAEQKPEVKQAENNGTHRLFGK